MKVYRAETVIIGAGFAGLSTAYYLASRGRKLLLAGRVARARGTPLDLEGLRFARRPGQWNAPRSPGRKSVLVIEQDKKLGGHSSGRNAGMIRQAVGDPVLARLAADGRKRLSREAGRWEGVSFKSNGSLLLAKKDGVEELKATAANLKKIRLSHRWLSKEESVRLVPILKQADFDAALFCPTDALIEIKALLNGFLKALKKRGIEVLRGCRLQRIQKQDSGFLIESKGRKIFAKQVVNAAGAWAGLVGKIAGAVPVPLVAYRRHLYETKAFGKSAKRWPFVWDVSRHFYFRPTPQGLLLSPCDKTPCKVSPQTTPACRTGRDDRRQTTEIVGEKIDPRMKGILLKKLRKFSKNFSKIKLYGGKAGLRTMAPDGRFVIGEDPKLKGFFWVAGLGGHGVTTSFSVGRLTADLILGRKVDRRIQKAMSPSRFLRR